jgi:hypothetical protein
MENEQPTCISTYHERNKCLCSLCFPKAVEIAEFGKGPEYALYLFEDEGRYGLMSLYGHRDQELFWFPKKPTPDPDPECEIDSPEADAWLDDMELFEEAMKMSPCEGHFFIECSLLAGWRSKDGKYTSNRFACWLVNYCGELIRDFETKVKSTP